jgi:hypothetical protein
MAGIAVCMFLSSISAGEAAKYPGKGAYEIGGDVSYYTQDYILVSRNGNGNVKQHVLSIEPCFNYYIATGVYVSPVIGFTGYFLSRKEDEGTASFNHYCYSLGARLGYVAYTHGPFHVFCGMGALYNFDTYGYDNVSTNGPANGFFISPFFGVKLVPVSHVAFPVTANFRIGSNDNKTTIDFAVNVGLLYLSY